MSSSDIIGEFLNNKLNISLNNYVVINSSDYTFEDELIILLLKKYDYSLMLGYETSHLYNYLPLNIKKLTLNIEYSGQIQFPFTKLPQQLKELTILSEIDDFNDELNNLPLELEKITIISKKFNKSLDNLPIKLKCLELYVNEFNQPLNNLPQFLETLKICRYSAYDNFNMDRHNLDNLPLHLETLELDKYCSKYFNLDIIDEKNNDKTNKLIINFV